MNTQKLGLLHALCVVFGLVCGVLLVNCVQQGTDTDSAVDAPTAALQEPGAVVAAVDTVPSPARVVLRPEQPLRETQKPVARFDRKGRCMHVIMMAGEMPWRDGCQAFARVVENPHQFTQYRARTQAQEHRWRAEAP